MKYIINVLSTIVLAFLSAQPVHADLQLLLHSKVNTLRLGEKETLSLKIVGNEISKITAETEGIDYSPIRPAEFTYYFDFKPQKEGVFTVGPYTLSVMGNELTSNQITITVLPKWDGTLGTFFRVDRTTIEHGDHVELVMETWAEERSQEVIALDHRETFDWSAGSMFSQSTSSNTSGKVFFSKRSWRITPESTGVFHLNQECFREFPDGLQAPDFQIHVISAEEKGK